MFYFPKNFKEFRIWIKSIREILPQSWKSAKLGRFFGEIGFTLRSAALGKKGRKRAMDFRACLAPEPLFRAVGSIALSLRRRLRETRQSIAQFSHKFPSAQKAKYNNYLFLKIQNLGHFGNNDDTRKTTRYKKNLRGISKEPQKSLKWAKQVKKEKNSRKNEFLKSPIF